MIHRVTVVAACALMFGCAPAMPALDDLIGFSDPQACEPDEAFAALLQGMIVFDEAGETYVPVLREPPVQSTFKDQVGVPDLSFDGHEYRATLPLRGTWHGLPLRSIVVVGWIESEQGFELLFKADPELVLTTANRVGFGIPSSGSEYRDDDVLGLNVGVEKRDGGAALFCIPG